jgi:hypothetical protein
MNHYVPNGSDGDDGGGGDDDDDDGDDSGDDDDNDGDVCFNKLRKKSHKLSFMRTNQKDISTMISIIIGINVISIIEIPLLC